MLVEGFGVVLRAPSGQPYPEVEHQGKTYVVGVPSAAYSIELVPPPHNSIQLEADISIDGRDLGYAPCLKAPSRLVRGFLVAKDGRNLEQAFHFARPGTSQAAVAAALQCTGSTLAGQIRVEFTERGAPQADQPRGSSLSSNMCVADRPAVKKEEGVKWFHRASLATAVGDPVPSSIIFDTTPRGQGRHLCTARLYVETAAALRLRKILDDRNPEHRAILQEGMEKVPDEAPVQQSAAAQTLATPDQVDKPPDSKRPRHSSMVHPVIDLEAPRTSAMMPIDLM